jgi:hypothetical protein
VAEPQREISQILNTHQLSIKGASQFWIKGKYNKMKQVGAAV